MRLKDAVQYDLTQALEYIPNTFGVTISYGEVSQQLQRLISEKVENYIHQRYKDWAVKDLLTAVEVLEELNPKKKSPAKTSP